MRSFNIKIAGIAGCLAVLLVGAAAAGEPVCNGIEIRSGAMIFNDGFESGGVSAWGSPEPGFRATRILDLDLEVRFAGLSDNHVLHVKLLTPGGHHYQTLTAPIAAAGAQVGVRRVEGYPRPLAVRVAQPLATGNESLTSAVVLQLPVGGTSIVSSALYGRWTVEAYLDQATAVCTSASFVLSP